MISLNRPYDVRNDKRLRQNKYREAQLTYSSREGLNVIYRKLYEERGTMRIAVSPLTCFIAIYPMVVNGHIPVFIDIDPLTLNMDEEKLLQRTDVDAVQVIHLGGNPMRMDMVMEWARKNRIVVIEDCAQALGATYNGQEVGMFGEYAVASVVKNVYGVCGGILIGDSGIKEDDCKSISLILIIYKRIKRFLEKKANAKRWGVWNMLYGVLLRLKDTQENGFANVVHLLPKKVDKELREKLEYWKWIDEKRKEKAKRLIVQIDRTKYAIQQEPKRGVCTRNRILIVSRYYPAKDVIRKLRKRGIAANNLTQSYTHSYQEHVREDSIIGKYYTELLDNYESTLPKVVCVPCSPALSDKEIDYIAKELNSL